MWRARQSRHTDVPHPDPLPTTGEGIRKGGESEIAVDQILCAGIVFDLGLVDSVCRLGWEVVRWMVFRGPEWVRNGLTLD